jgi:hypothetical protein
MALASLIAVTMDKFYLVEKTPLVESHWSWIQRKPGGQKMGTTDVVRVASTDEQHFDFVDCCHFIPCELGINFLTSWKKLDEHDEHTRGNGLLPTHSGSGRSPSGFV